MVTGPIQSQFEFHVGHARHRTDARDGCCVSLIRRDETASFFLLYLPYNSQRSIIIARFWGKGEIEKDRNHLEARAESWNSWLVFIVIFGDSPMFFRHIFFLMSLPFIYRRILTDYAWRKVVWNALWFSQITYPHSLLIFDWHFRNMRSLGSELCFEDLICSL